MVKRAVVTISATGSSDLPESRNSFSAGGFTIIEVLVAIVILSLSLVAIIGAYGGYVNALDRASEQLLMQRIAKDLQGDIDRVRLFERSSRRRGAVTGSREEAGRMYEWQVKVRPASTVSSKQFDEVTITISRGESRRLERELLLAR